MTDFELFQERKISGKGMLRVPTELKKRRAVVLYCDLVRPPLSPYYNAGYSPPQSFYGNIVFLREGYVIAEDKIKYKQQAWSDVPDITAQNLIAIKCMYKGVLQSFINFANAQGLTLVSVEDKIKDYEYLDLMWDEARVVCYASTALNLRLYALPNDKCQDDADKPRKPKRPPPPPPEVPPDQPIEDLDPPYEDEENPDNVTEPFEGDEFPEEPPPPPDPPAGTRLKWNVSTNLNPRTTYAQAVFVTFFPVSNYQVTQGNTDASVNAREWKTSFISGDSTIEGSAVGTLSPEDKPSLYLWIEGQDPTLPPFAILSP